MPFTPFHMGAALLVKPALQKRISVISFGLAQIAMDVEPGIGMLRDADVLHGPTHTFVGALVIGLIVGWMSPRVVGLLLRLWNREVSFHKVAWLAEENVASRWPIYFGSLLGTFSHIVLDSLMHHDMHPFAPFSSANPFIGYIDHDAVYVACACAAAIGILIWLVTKRLRKFS